MHEEFFSVVHSLPVNVIPVQGDYLPSIAELEAEMPEPFRIASAISAIDLGTSRLMRAQGSEHLQDLIEVINQQSRKIDLIMGYVLAVQDHPEHRFHTLRLGGGELHYLFPFEGHGEPPKSGQLVRLKIFLREEASAVYCYGRVKGVTRGEHGHHVELDYACIRDEDRELLVRASLHIQSRQLKQRASERHRNT
ncbi:hypothetical protein ATO46_17280 [Aeromonas schubertii]|uniref:hypothetical protein n=1 Tax=Aeromonas schubertii TaxID=652 RepID=UPI00067E886D|nr:hypothetical protein [Aeromonas schubertii]KUE79937.1 hypothetical protein ATO46_17280 [Aeromonas schubertii]